MLGQEITSFSYLASYHDKAFTPQGEAEGGLGYRDKPASDRQRPCLQLHAPDKKVLGQLGSDITESLNRDFQLETR